MFDTFGFIGGILLGTFLGTLATLVYHVRQLRQEARQNYVRLSLAHAEVATLERTLEIHRRTTVTDSTQPLRDASEPESEKASTPLLIPAWIGNLESPIAAGKPSEQVVDYAPGVQQGYVRITPIREEIPFVTYAVINDGASPGERTGDGAFIASSP